MRYRSERQTLVLPSQGWPGLLPDPGTESNHYCNSSKHLYRIYGTPSIVLNMRISHIDIVVFHNEPMIRYSLHFADEENEPERLSTCPRSHS